MLLGKCDVAPDRGKGRLDVSTAQVIARSASTGSARQEET